MSSQGDAVSRSGTSTSVAIVDEHVLFTECLEVALNLRGYECRLIPVPQVPGTAVALLTAVLNARADVVVLNSDLGMVRGGGRLIEPLAASGAPVIAVTDSTDLARWGELLMNGARTVLAKGGSLECIMSAIENIILRVPAMTLQRRHELLQSYRHEDPELRGLRARLDRLTLRESEVLSHLMGGRTVTDIARLSVTSEATVRTQVKSILCKLEVCSQIAAVGLAYQCDWRPYVSVPDRRPEDHGRQGPVTEGSVAVRQR